MTQPGDASAHPNRSAENLLLVAAALAPWLLGATLRWPPLLWLGLAPLPAAFALVFFRRTGTRAPLGCVLICLALIGCVIRWGSLPAPAYATPLTAAHFEFLSKSIPGVLLEGWSRSAVLALPVCALLGLIAAARLAGEATFRRRLYRILAFNGLAVAALGISSRLFGLGTVPWVILAGDKESHDVCFFHHNAPGAAFNMAWPLLLFGSGLAPKFASRNGFKLLVALLTAIILPIWHSTSGQAIACVLWAVWFLWLLAERSGRVRPALFGLSAWAAVALVVTMQISSLVDLEREHPDGWISAASSLESAPRRETELRQRMLLRRDRLVSSDAPARPVAWRAGVRMAADYPVLGLGPGAWAARANLYSHDSLMHTFHQHRRFAHSDLLQTAAEWGVVPALGWIILWASALGLASRALALGEAGLFLALFGVVLGALVYFPLQNPAVQIWTALLMGIALGLPPRRESPVA